MADDPLGLTKNLDNLRARIRALQYDMGLDRKAGTPEDQFTGTKQKIQKLRDLMKGGGGEQRDSENDVTDYLLSQGIAPAGDTLSLAKKGAQYFNTGLDWLLHPPKEAFSNTTGEKVFPTNAVENLIAGSSQPSGELAAAFVGPGGVERPRAVRAPTMRPGLARSGLPEKIEAQRGTFPTGPMEIAPPRLMKKIKHRDGTESTQHVSTGWSQAKQRLVDSGDYFWSKGETEQSSKAQKMRTELSKFIRENPDWMKEHAPFDLRKLARVKRSDYPRDDYDPLRDEYPKTGEMSETAKRWRKIYNSKHAQKELRKAYDAGNQIEGIGKWYWVKQWEDMYREAFGDNLGRQMFLDDFTGAMAATTAKVTPLDNFRTSTLANYYREHGYELPEHLENYRKYLEKRGLPGVDWPVQGAFTPPGPGGPYLGSNLKEFRDYIQRGGGLMGKGKPKRRGFQESFGGNKRIPVMDEKMMYPLTKHSRLGIEQRPEYYSIAAEPVLNLAEDVGESDLPSVQAKTWFGVQNQLNPGRSAHPMMQDINQAAMIKGLMSEDPSLDPRDAALAAILRTIRRQGTMTGVAGAGLARAMQQGQDDAGRNE